MADTSAELPEARVSLSLSEPSWCATKSVSLDEEWPVTSSPTTSVPSGVVPGSQTPAISNDLAGIETVTQVPEEPLDTTRERHDHTNTTQKIIQTSGTDNQISQLQRLTTSPENDASMELKTDKNHEQNSQSSGRASVSSGNSSHRNTQASSHVSDSPARKPLAHEATPNDPLRAVNITRTRILAGNGLCLALGRYYNFGTSAAPRIFRWVVFPKKAQLSLPGGVTISINKIEPLDGLRLSDQHLSPEDDGASSMDSSGTDQGLCWARAESMWSDWTEAPGLEWRPTLIVYIGNRSTLVKGRAWDMNDVWRPSGRDCLKLWKFRHDLDKPLRPGILGVEFVIILASAVIESTMDMRSISQLPEVEKERYRLYVQRLKSGAARVTLNHVTNYHANMRISFADEPVFHLCIRKFCDLGIDEVLFKAMDASHGRDKGLFPANVNGKEIFHNKPWFSEIRISILVFHDPNGVPKAVVVIEDRTPRIWDKGSLDAAAATPDQIVPRLLQEYYDAWEMSWNGCLDHVDDCVRITLKNLSDEAKLDSFMFDGPKFRLSRSYFATLQVLRIFTDYVRETRRDFDAARKQFGRLYAQVNPEGWERTYQCLTDAEERLLHRIDRKVEEIKTLRDGLFNSTSVREATRSTEMNRYVIVFTVVTVIYTPPSFVSTLFATPLPYFTKGDPDEFKQAVAIATVTTLVAALTLLALANSFDDIFKSPRSFFGPRIAFAQAWGQYLIAEASRRLRLEALRKAVSDAAFRLLPGTRMSGTTSPSTYSSD